MRLYDKKGLLPSDKNEVNGYRTYTREDVVTMDYICRLKKMHFSLEEIRRIMNEEPLEQVAEMAAEQQRRLEEEVRELQHLIGYLADYHEKLEQVLTYEKNREEEQTAKIEIVDAPCRLLLLPPQSPPSKTGSDWNPTCESSPSPRPYSW